MTNEAGLEFENQRSKSGNFIIPLGSIVLHDRGAELVFDKGFLSGKITYQFDIIQDLISELQILKGAMAENYGSVGVQSVLNQLDVNNNKKNFLSMRGK